MRQIVNPLGFMLIFTARKVIYQTLLIGTGDPASLWRPALSRMNVKR
jgi:hypothetical protein